MRRIKICHLIKPATNNPLLYNSIKFSDRERFAYTTISLDPEGALQEQMRELNVETYSIDRPSRRELPRAVATLTKIFRRKAFDIVQVHGFDASVAGLPAAWMAGVRNRIFSGHHSHEIPLHKNPKLTMVDRFLASRLATGVVAPSNNMRDIFREVQRVPDKKLVVIPHGIDLEYWSPEVRKGGAVRRDLGIGRDTPVFGAVGRLYWVKGFEMLIRCFARVVERHSDVVLFIVGEGDDRPVLERLIASEGLTDRVHLLGNRDDVADVMADLDVLVHPSIAESFGLVFVEAMALGKPVIGTAVGIAPELIRDGENGFLFEAGSEAGLSASMEKVLELRASWPEMQSAARKSSERYSVVLTQRECDGYYASLVR